MCFATVLVFAAIYTQLLHLPRHFPQCTTCSPLELNIISVVPVNASSPMLSELLRRLKILLVGGKFVLSIFLGEDVGWQCATELPGDFFWSGEGISFAGLSSVSFVFALCVEGSVLEFFSCQRSKLMYIGPEFFFQNRDPKLIKNHCKPIMSIICHVGTTTCSPFKTVSWKEHGLTQFTRLVNIVNSLLTEITTILRLLFSFMASSLLWSSSSISRFWSKW